MPNEFDAGKEADRISQLAKDAIDESRPLHQSQALRALEQEYLSLTQPQRNAVGLELENKDSWHSALPTPQVRIDGKGDVTSIAFERSAWDVHKSGYEAVEIADDYVAYGESANMAGNVEIPHQIRGTHEVEWVEIPPIAARNIGHISHHNKRSHRPGH